MTKLTFSILITTKNRKDDLVLTLSKINDLIERPDVRCVVFDDGSHDGTYELIKEIFPTIKVKRNPVSRGYIYCRNVMLNETKADYAISLDDDAHFLSEDPLAIIENHFLENSNCGLVALRIFWGLREPGSVVSNESTHKVQGFVGCAHVWRMSAWRAIPDYPEWFVFYGEENFASYQLFKKNWEIHYLPEVLVNHRVDVKARRNNADYTIRLRRSLRSGWYLYFLFYPWAQIPRRISFSIWMQLKIKVFKGDFKALKAMILALVDLVVNFPRIIKNSNRLNIEEYKIYERLSSAKIYWKPEDEK